MAKLYALTPMPRDDDHWMQIALDEARAAQRHGDVPVGAVIARGDEELARGHNRREVDGDPTAHAEIVAIRAAAARIGHWRLEGCTLFATLEPCAMCAGALVNARVARLVFGATDPKAGAAVTLYEIPKDPRLNHRLEVTSGLRATEAAQLLGGFFSELRARGEK